MRNALIISVLGIGAAFGCAPQAAGPVKPRPVDSAPVQQVTQVATIDPVVATAGSTKITRSELEKVVMQAYGFNVLMYVVQRDMAEDACREQKIVVTPEDLARERKWTIEQMFAAAPEKEDREKLLEQYLQQPKPRDQMISRAEFEIILQTNAYLRKLAEAIPQTAITDEFLKMEFDTKYGAKVRVRHIMVANPQEAMQAKRRLDAGESFADVAQAMSRNPNTKRLGGELPPFTSQDTRVAENFRRVAFAMKDNEISDPIQAEGSYHIVQLLERIPPKAVKFEDVKDSLREGAANALVLENVKDIRNRLGKQALATLKIEDPDLKREFDSRLKAREHVIQDREKIREEMEKQRETVPVGPAPTTVPAAEKPEAPAGATTIPAPTTAPAATQP